MYIYPSLIFVARKNNIAIDLNLKYVNGHKEPTNITPDWSTRIGQGTILATGILGLPKSFSNLSSNKC